MTYSGSGGAIERRQRLFLLGVATTMALIAGGIIGLAYGHLYTGCIGLIIGSSLLYGGVRDLYLRRSERKIAASIQP